MLRLHNAKKVNWNGSPFSEQNTERPEFPMPYEGCGPMYECPHYCPVHLFAATAPPETAGARPLRLALLLALKLKFANLEAELKNRQLECAKEEEEEEKSKSIGNTDPFEGEQLFLKKSEKIQPNQQQTVTPHVPLAAKGDDPFQLRKADTVSFENIKNYVKKRSSMKVRAKLLRRNSSQNSLGKAPHLRAGVVD